jgi:bacterioferritin (cytochrome b1)
MNGKRALVAALREALQAELNAVKMYAAHAEAVSDQEIAQGLWTILEVEKEHARLLASRIEALQREPIEVESSVAPPHAGPVADPVAVAELLSSDLADEQWAIKHYASTWADFLLEVDEETLAILEENLVDELRHARWLRDRLQGINAVRGKQGRG